MRVVSGEKSGGSWGILPCPISTFEKNYPDFGNKHLDCVHL